MKLVLDFIKFRLQSNRIYKKNWSTEEDLEQTFQL